MKRNRPHAAITEAIDALPQDPSIKQDGDGDPADRLQMLTKQLRAKAGRATAETAVGFGLAADQIDLIRDGHFDPEVATAIGRIGSDLPNGAVHVASAAELMGWTNVIAGTVFEQAVTEAANNGKFALPNGADHVVLAGRVQEGWDLDLMRGNEVVGHAQVKFSANDHTILLHLQNHPDIPIVIANHEAATAAAHAGVPVIDAHIDYAPLHDTVQSEVADHLGLTHFIHEWVPEAALVIILGMAICKLRSGEPRSDVLRWAKEQAAISGVANGAATIASMLTGHELVRLPTALMTRFWIARADVSGTAHKRAHATRGALLTHVGLSPVAVW